MAYEEIIDKMSEDLKMYVYHARNDNWQFMFEPNDAYAPDDVRTWQKKSSELLSQSLDGQQTQAELAELTLDAAMRKDKWQEAMAVALLVDRYLYGHSRNRTEDLLRKVDEISAKGGLGIPLQMKIRRGRVLRDKGNLLEALQHLDDLMASAAGSQAREEEVKAAKARCLYIKAEIKYRLGLWLDAARNAVESIAVSAKEFSRGPDTKNIAIGFQVLSQILRNITPDVYGQLQEIIDFKVHECPYEQAYVFNRYAATLSKSDPRAFSRHQHSAGKAMLLHCYSSTQSMSEQQTQDCLTKAVRELELGLRAQAFIKVLSNKDQKHDFAHCLHSLGIAYDGQGKTSLSNRVNKMSKDTYKRFQEREPIDDIVGELNTVLKEIGLDAVNQLDDYSKDYIDKYIYDLNVRQEIAYPSLKQHMNESLTMPKPALFRRLSQAARPAMIPVENEEAKIHTKPVDDSSTSFSAVREMPSELEDQTVAPIPKGKSIVKLSSKRPTSVQHNTPSVHYNYRPIVRNSMGIAAGIEDAEWEVVGREEYFGDARTLAVRGVHDALVYQYRPITNDWKYWRTIVQIGTKLTPEVRGYNRDLLFIKFLNQPDYKAQHVAKYYPNPEEVSKYFKDVIKQELARYLVAQFNDELTKQKQNHPQVDMLPSLHVQILDSEGTVVEYVNIEQYIGSGYKKIADAFGGVDKTSANKEFLTALSHYSGQRTNWNLLIDDIQGWEQKEERENESHGEEQQSRRESRRIILTDPGIATVDETLVKACGTSLARGLRGIKDFWSGRSESHGFTHDSNKYCKSLKLTKPPETAIEEVVDTQLDNFNIM